MAVFGVHCLKPWTASLLGHIGVLFASGNEMMKYNILGNEEISALEYTRKEPLLDVFTNGILLRNRSRVLYCALRVILYTL